MALSLQKLNQIEATLNAKFPNMKASEKAAVTQILNQKRAELLSGAGVSPSDVPTDPLQEGVLEQNVSKGTYEPKMSASSQARHDALQTALSSLDAAETNLVAAGGAKGPIGGALATLPLIGQFTDPAGAAYHATKVELATQLAKAITGGARAPENIVEQYLHSLPDVNDTPEFAKQKVAKLRSELLTQAKTYKLKDITDAYQPQTSNPLQQTGVLPTPTVQPTNDVNSYLDKYYPKK